MKHIGLFEGIGGFSLAATWMGWETIVQCEINPFCQQVLKYHYPKAILHGDIKATSFIPYRGQCDILTGGFPCQPYSTAGKRKGKEDDRHLWPEMLRAIREIRPRWVVGENVRGLTNWNGGMVFDEVQADLEAEGYEVLPFLLPACAVNAPHRRDRIWFIAHNNNRDREEKRFQAGGQIHVDRTQGAGAATNPNDCLHTGGLDIRGNREEKAGSESKDQQQGGWNENGQRLRAEPGTSGAATPNTEINGSGRIVRHMEVKDGEQQAQKESGESKPTAGSISDVGNAANASNKGLQRSEINGSVGSSGQEQHEQSAGLFRTDWQDFPTQSPLCNGNDGLPFRLDRGAISFAKWRNESIKAAGNAVVPQLVLEIYKAIEAFETIASKQSCTAL